MDTFFLFFFCCFCRFASLGHLLCQAWRLQLLQAVGFMIPSHSFFFCFFSPTTSVTLTGHEMKNCRAPAAKWGSFPARVVDWLEIFSFLVFFTFGLRSSLKAFCSGKKNDFFSPSTCVFVWLVCQPAQQFWKMKTCLLRFYRLLLFWFCWTFYITSRPETPLQTIFLMSLY